jgi:uncharacterized metal-binding protein
VDLIFLSRVSISSLVSPLHKPIVHDFLSRSLSLYAFCCSLTGAEWTTLSPRFLPSRSLRGCCDNPF